MGLIVPDIAAAALLLEPKNFRRAILEGSALDLFEGPGAAVMNFTAAFYRKYGSLPDRTTIYQSTEVEVPSLDEVKEPLDYWLDFLTRRKVGTMAGEIMEKAARFLGDGKVDEVVDLFDEFLRKARTHNHQSVEIPDLSDLVEYQWDAYQRRKMGEEAIDGIRTPWPLLDSETLGYQPGELISVIAKFSTGKSFFMLLLAQKAWETGKKVLLVSPEMTPLSLSRRFSSLGSKVPFNKIRKGELDEFEEQDYRGFLDELAQKPGIRIIVGQKLRTVPQINEMVVQYEPDVLLIDGIYLLRAPQIKGKLHEKVFQIVTDVRVIAEQNEIPVVCSSQLNADAKYGDIKGLSPDNVAFSNALNYESDIMLALGQNDQMRREKRMLVKILKGRDFEKFDFLINWDLDNMNFTEIERVEGDGYVDSASQYEGNADKLVPF